MKHAFQLSAGPLTHVIVTPNTEAAKQFLADFGPVDQENASTFIHAATAAGLPVQHTQGDIPKGVSLIDWHDSWDGRSRL